MNNYNYYTSITTNPWQMGYPPSADENHMIWLNYWHSFLNWCFQGQKQIMILSIYPFFETAFHFS